MDLESAVDHHWMRAHQNAPLIDVGEVAHVGPEATSPVARLIMLQDALQPGIAVGGRSPRARRCALGRRQKSAGSWVILAGAIRLLGGWVVVDPAAFSYRWSCNTTDGGFE